MFDVRELNVGIELWGVAFCVIGIACLLAFSRTDVRYRGLLVIAFATELVASGSDALAGLFRGQEGLLATMMVYGGNHVTFLGNFALVTVLTLYMCTRIEDAGGPEYRTWRVAAVAMTGFVCLLSLFGAFFYIDDANLYHRTDWYWVSLAYVMVVNCVNAVLAIRSRNRLGKTALVCLLFYAIAPIVASAIQTFVYGLNFVIVAGVMSLMVVFFEMQQHAARVFTERTEELAQARVEASESRIAVMVSQIQPHFLFHTLDTIYGLVDEDTDKAKAAIASFSRYLRTNLDSLKHTSPVSIEREMEHVRTYLELERMSDESRLAYELDVQATGFLVPALSVQTLAENAVKHGLGGRERGGTVIVRTREQLGEYTVTIIDDGVGFDPDDRSGAGVGLENTQARLAAMCSGELEVHSAPGEGTTVGMHIPRRVERAGLGESSL